MERIYKKTIIKNEKNRYHVGMITNSISGGRGLLYLANSLYFFPIRYYSSKVITLETLSEEKKAENEEKLLIYRKKELLKKGFPAVFKDMSKLKDENYMAIVKRWAKPINFLSLKKLPGIYMITNKVTKKVYIGMSANLHSRFYNYLDINRLKRDGSSRINKALLKYGFQNFSITILELTDIIGTNERFLHNSISFRLTGKNNIANHLRKREDYFIKAFKPQYNIKSYLATRDLEFNRFKSKIYWEIPLRIRSLLDKCLDTDYLDHNLVTFTFSKMDRSFKFTAVIPKNTVKANSLGWKEGKIVEERGFEQSPLNKKAPLNWIIDVQALVNPMMLAEFYTGEGEGISYVKNCLKNKLKALKIALKNDLSKKNE
jgi:hypothetical protein